MLQSLSKNIKITYYDLMIFPLFSLCFFVYLWQKINPVLYYQKQEPVFFLDERFFNEFLGYPGGLLEYISAFLSQSYYYSWLGALVLTVIVFFVSIISKNIIKTVSNQKQIYILHLLPAALLLVLYTNYEFPLSVTLGLLISLGFFKLYIKYILNNNLWQVFYFSFLFVILYYVTAGVSFLFVILCVIYELWLRQKYVAGVISLVISAIVPYAAYKYLFIVSFKDTYTYLLAFEKDSLSSPELYILYFYFPVIILLIFVVNKFVHEEIKEKIKKIFFLKSKHRYLIPPAILLIGTYFPATNTFDNEKKALLLIDYNARKNNWEEVLQLITPQMLNNKLVSCQLNRALYHTNRLSSEMFSYPQHAGLEGLIFSEEIGAVAPFLRSDIFFDLGHINEAKHWACEALAVTGYNPWNLKMIALTSIIKGEKQTAQKCLNLLNKTLLYGDWVKKYQPYVNDKAMLAKDEEMRTIVPYKGKTDFIIQPNSLAFDLESMLLFGKPNKMAFEYLMACYLIDVRLDKFIKKLELLPEYGYKKIPRHYEEALLAYDTFTDIGDFNISKFKISSETYNRFNGMQDILRRYNGNKIEAVGEIMAKYGNTYWAYILYKQ